MYLFRDRLGKKNLYWTNQGEYWLFSTELKGLLSTGLVPQTPSVVGLASYLNFGFIPQDLSPIKGVNKLLPGHFVKVDLKRRTSLNQYWSLSRHFESKREESPLNFEQDLTTQLFSVIDTLPQKFPFHVLSTKTEGSHLLISLLESKFGKEQIQVYGATEPSKTLQQDLTPETIVLDLLKMVWHLDEPIADLRTLAVWNEGKKASNKTSSIVGDAGWEQLFGGNPRYFFQDVAKHSTFIHYLSELPPGLKKQFLMPLLRFFDFNLRWKILRNVDINRDQLAYLEKLALFKKKERKKVSSLLFKYFDPEVFSQRFHRLHTVSGHIDPFLYFDDKTVLPDLLLHYSERLLKAHNLILHTPFLNHRLIEWMAEIPEDVKFQNDRSVFLEHYLKQHPLTSIENFEDLYLKKWKLSPLFKELFAKLEKGMLVEEGFVSARWIRQQLGYPYLIETNFKQLWALLILEIWFRLFIDCPIGSVDLDKPLLNFLE